MLKNLKNREKGFTIIEVLIVLAIAGLIMLVVFLAVPALQRNSRNTQRKADIAGILGGVSEFSNNNGGSLPDSVYTAGAGTNNFEWRRTAATTGTRVNLGIYADTDLNYNINSNAAIGAARVLGTVFIRGNAKCNATGDDIGGANPTSRSIAVVYGVENAGAPTFICQES